jgi:hypothetical protein
MSKGNFTVYTRLIFFFLNMSVDTVSLFVYQGTVYSSMSFSLNRLGHVKCLPILYNKGVATCPKVILQFNIDTCASVIKMSA